jgi:hypothetical protein
LSLYVSYGSYPRLTMRPTHKNKSSNILLWTHPPQNTRL